MKNRKDMEAEAMQQSSEIAQRKVAFQKENRRQMREGILYADEVSFISREAAKTATFCFIV